MSVIAKLQLNGTLDFGTGSLSKLSCICENDLMAAYAKADEDRLFTKYSPWGEMKLGHKFADKHGMLKFNTPHPFYVIALRNEPTEAGLKIEKPNCEGAEHVHPARCHVIHDFGNSKQVEMVHDPRHHGGPMTGDYEHPGELHWRMTIDNPPAVKFFEPGRHGYWIAFYDATKFSIQEALADAHRGL